MNPTILNREFQHPADAWYQIEAKGSHPNRAAGVVQVIDDEAAQSIVNRFNADAAAGTLRHGSEMLIDHEHFSDQADKESRAYGWATKLENRADGIYAQIRWTKTGKEAVDGGDYRFFSTEYSPADLAELRTQNSERGTAKRVRPMRLDGLTLTNMHNNRGQKPITNREGDGERVMNKDGFVTIDGHVVFIGADKDTTDDEGGAIYGSLAKQVEGNYRDGIKSGALSRRDATDALDSLTIEQRRYKQEGNAEMAKRHASRIAGIKRALNRQPLSGALPGMQSTNNPKNRMTTIAAELGLAPEAAEEAVLAEVRKLKNRAALVDGLTTERDTLRTRNTELEAEQIDGLLAAHGVKEEKVLNRLKPVLAGLKNRADRTAFLTEVLPAPAPAAKPAAPAARVLNRADAKPAATASAAAAPDAQNTHVRLVMNREKCDFRRAWDLARVEKPELFA